MKSLYWLTFLLCIFVFPNSYAQDFHIKEYGVEFSIPRKIKDVYQDQLGYVWIASDDGLVQFDGQKLKFFEKHLPSPYVKKILPLHSGKLLVITDEGIVKVHMKGTQVNIEPWFSHVDISFSKDAFQDSQGRVWVSSVNDIKLFDEKKNKVNTFPYPKISYSKDLLRSFSITERENHQIWAVSRQGHMLLFDENRYEFTQVTSPILHEEVDDTEWLDAEHLIVASKKLSILTMADNQVADIEVVEHFENGAGNIVVINHEAFFLASQSNGLHRGSLQKGKCKLTRIGGKRLTDLQNISVGNSDQLWIAGPLSIFLVSELPITPQKDFMKDYVQSIVSDNEHVYVSNGDVIRYHYQTGEEKILYARKNGRATGLEVKDGEVYLGTSLGTLWKVDQSGQLVSLKIPKKSLNAIYYLEFDNYGHLWGVQEPLFGPFKFDGKTYKFYGEDDGLKSRIIAIKNIDGTIYACGSGGDHWLYKYDPNNDQFVDISVKFDMELSEEFAINDFVIDPNENFWLATSDGVFVYDITRKELEHVKIEPYHSFDARSILADEEGNVWVSTSNGLVCLNQDKNSLYDLNTGLSTLDLTYRALTIDQGNHLWIGTTRGYSKANSDIFSSNEVTMKPQIKNFLVNHKDHPFFNEAPVIKESDLIELNLLTLDFPIENIEYQYRLKGGSNHHWTFPTKNHRIILSDLLPGNYELEIRARQTGKFWSDPASFTFVVRNSWLSNWLFTLSIVFLSLTIIWIIVRLNSWRLLVQKRRLKQLIEERTIEIYEQKKELEYQNEEIKSKSEEILTINQDLHKQREEVQILNDNLEKKVQKRTEELSSINIKLQNEINSRIKAEEDKNGLIHELERRNDELLQFSHIISHNLRGPIAQVLGLTSLFNKSPQEQSELAFNTEIIERLKYSASHLDMVIKDLTKILSIKDHKEEIFEEVNIKKVCHDVLEALLVEIQQKKALVITDNLEVEEVYGVKGYLYSILYNLISNAIKYSKEKVQPRIEISSAIAGSYVVITVKDNGKGLDMDAFKDKIFKLYQRFHLEVEGKGLGLYLVKSQVESMHGYVEMNSVVGMGTVFKAYLPRNSN